MQGAPSGKPSASSSVSFLRGCVPHRYSSMATPSNQGVAGFSQCLHVSSISQGVPSETRSNRLRRYTRVCGAAKTPTFTFSFAAKQGCAGANKTTKVVAAIHLVTNRKEVTISVGVH